MFQKIIVPLDGSELAERTLEVVRRILDRRRDLEDEREGATVVALLRVVTPDELGHGARLGRDELSVAHEELEHAAAKLGRAGRGATREVVMGDPAAVILEVARRGKATLIAMSTHGRTGVPRWVRGSVAERVLREAPCPVLLANPFALEGAKEVWTLPFQRILVPLDGSARAEAILPRVAPLAELFGGEILLLHVVTPYPFDDETGRGLALLEEEGRAALEAAKARLPRVRVRTRLAVGEPAAVILETAQAERTDLLAIATHGRSGTSRWVFGSVAEDVLHQVRCPVLVERTVTGAAARAAA